MKKSLLTLLFFLLAVSAYSWDANTLAVYDFENNLTDSTGNGYTLSNYGSETFYHTDIVKYGTYSYQPVDGGDWAYLPASLNTVLGASTDWSIGGWVYTTDDTTYTPILEWYAPETNFEIATAKDGTGRYFIWSYYGQNANEYCGTNGDWNYWSMDYDDSAKTLKCYINGSLAHTFSSVTGNIFAYTASFIFVNMHFNGTANWGARSDRITFSNCLRNGVEVTETTPTNTPVITATNTPIATPTFTASPTATYGWYEASTQTAWPVRDKFNVLNFNNELWVLNGTLRDTLMYKDVWHSSNGVDWTATTKAAEYGGMLLPLACVYDNKMWVIGVDSWYSTDGIVWTQANVSALPFNGLGWQSNGLFVVNNKMYAFGGPKVEVYDPFCCCARQHCWSSTDGDTWTDLGENLIPPRSGAAHFVFNNRMWIIGGTNSGIYYNDIYSSADGITWIKEKDHAEFANFDTAINAIVNGMVYLYIMNYDEVWRSGNGKDWTKITGYDSSFPPNRREAAGTEFNNLLWQMGGYYIDHDLNEAWNFNILYPTNTETPVYTYTPTVTASSVYTFTPTPTLTPYPVATIVMTLGNIGLLNYAPTPVTFSAGSAIPNGRPIAIQYHWTFDTPCSYPFVFYYYSADGLYSASNFYINGFAVGGSATENTDGKSVTFTVTYLAVPAFLEFSYFSYNNHTLLAGHYVGEAWIAPNFTVTPVKINNDIIIDVYTPTITLTPVCTFTRTVTPTITLTPVYNKMLYIPKTATGAYCVGWPVVSGALGYMLAFNTGYQLWIPVYASVGDSYVFKYNLNLAILPKRSSIVSVQEFVKKSVGKTGQWQLVGPGAIWGCGP